MSWEIWAILVGVGLAGIVMAWLGRYRRVERDQAFCRACEYQLASIIPTMLPETGAGEDDDDREEAREETQGEGGGGGSGGSGGSTEAEDVGTLTDERDDLPQDDVAPAAADSEAETDADCRRFPARCTECGADLTRSKAVMWGRRAPAIWQILIGTMITLGVSIVLIAPHAESFSRIRWVTYMPTAWLLRTDVSANNNLGNEEVLELRHRLGEGSMGPAGRQMMSHLITERARNSFEQRGPSQVAWTGSSLYLLKNYKPTDTPLLDDMLHYMMQSEWGATRIRLLPDIPANRAAASAAAPLSEFLIREPSADDHQDDAAQTATRWWIDSPIVVFVPHNQPWIPTAHYPGLIGYPTAFRIMDDDDQIIAELNSAGTTGIRAAGNDDLYRGFDDLWVYPTDPTALQAEGATLKARVRIEWFFVDDDLTELLTVWDIDSTNMVLAAAALPNTLESKFAEAGGGPVDNNDDSVSDSNSDSDSDSGRDSDTDSTLHRLSSGGVTSDEAADAIVQGSTDAEEGDNALRNSTASGADESPTVVAAEEHPVFTYASSMPALSMTGRNVGKSRAGTGTAGNDPARSRTAATTANADHTQIALQQMLERIRRQSPIGAPFMPPIRLEHWHTSMHEVEVEVLKPFMITPRVDLGIDHIEMPFGNRDVDSAGDTAASVTATDDGGSGAPDNIAAGDTAAPSFPPLLRGNQPGSLRLIMDTSIGARPDTLPGWDTTP